MFTGIVTDVGRVVSVEETAGGVRRVVVETRYDVDEIALGASIACSGPCLTVVEKAAGRLSFDVSDETARRTTAGSWAPGTRLNLERALRMGDELGGHLVAGHADGIGTVEQVVSAGDTRRLALRAPDDLARFIAPRGSIAVDGVSLTVNECVGAVFWLTLIPHTLAETALGDCTEGAAVNLEIDLIARYVERLHTAGTG